MKYQVGDLTIIGELGTAGIPIAAPRTDYRGQCVVLGTMRWALIDGAFRLQQYRWFPELKSAEWCDVCLQDDSAEPPATNPPSSQVSP